MDPTYESVLPLQLMLDKITKRGQHRQPLESIMKALSSYVRLCLRRTETVCQLFRLLAM